MKPIGTIIYEGWGSDIFNQVYYHYVYGEKFPHVYIVSQYPFQLDGHVMCDKDYIDINTAMLEMFDSSPVIRWKNGGILKNNIQQQKALQRAKEAFPVGSKIKFGEYEVGVVAYHDVRYKYVKAVLDTKDGLKEFCVADTENENFVPIINK